MPALLTLPCLPAAEVDDLVGGSGLLEEGQEYRLPVLPLDGLVLCPGNTLPLRLSFRSDRALVQQALEAPPPLTRLIAVVCCTRSYFTPQLMLQRCAGRGAARVALRQRCLPRAAKAVALDPALIACTALPPPLDTQHAGWGAWRRFVRWAAAGPTCWPRGGSEWRWSWRR